MSEQNYQLLEVADGVPVKMWTKGVPVEAEARQQLANAARLPIVFKHIAAMPDVHLGIGATIGSVIPTVKAIIPAAVGVDIGCGMMAAKTTLRAEDLPDSLATLRSAIEKPCPMARHPKPWPRPWCLGEPSRSGGPEMGHAGRRVRRAVRAAPAPGKDQ